MAAHQIIFSLIWNLAPALLLTGLIIYLIRKNKQKSNNTTPAKQTITPTITSALYLAWWALLAPLWALPNWLSGKSGIDTIHSYGDNILHPLALAYIGGAFLIIIPAAFLTCGIIGFKNRKKDKNPKRATTLSYINIAGLAWQIICIITAFSISGGRI